MEDPKAVYFEILPCEVLSVHNEFNKDGTWTVIKLKPEDKNNFYINGTDMDEDTINKFIDTFKKNGKMKFEYQILYEPVVKEEEDKK